MTGITTVAAVLLTLSPRAAMAEETTCRGTIGSRTVDNVRVPDGATCLVEGTTVKGTIKVESNAVLKATDVSVVGNVQAENARNVVVRGGSTVGGSVQVVQGNAALVRGSRINGSVLFDEQSGPVAAKGNRVGEDVQAFHNTGGTEIANNTIDGNLQCKENRPRPTGGNNRVGGNKEDQCSRL